MNQKVISLLIIQSLLTACASQPTSQTITGLPAADTLPAARPELVHYIAWIPLEQAQTATVAEAMTHISLRSAHEQVSHDLCTGTLLSSGKVIEKYGPVAVRSPANHGGQAAWYYRISHEPELVNCSPAGNGSLYQALQTRLPTWISINPAQTSDKQTLGLSTATD